MSMKVWRLAVECNGEAVLRTPLEYFSDHFVGRPMAGEWKPARFTMRGGKGKRLPDFLSWMLSAPVISSKAKSALEPLIGPHAEILPMGAVRGIDLYAVNVVTLIDCLDEAGSQIVYSPDEPDRIMNILAFAFRDDCTPDAPIFKLSSYPNDVFVGPPFVDQVKAAGLVGAAFAEPSVNPFPLLMKGESVNVVAGLPK